MLTVVFTFYFMWICMVILNMLMGTTIISLYFWTHNGMDHYSEHERKLLLSLYKIAIAPPQHPPPPHTHTHISLFNLQLTLFDKSRVPSKNFIRAHHNTQEVCYFFTITSYILRFQKVYLGNFLHEHI